MDRMSNRFAYHAEQVAAAQGEFIRRVFNWMGLGLATTAVVSLATASSPALINLIFASGLFWVLLVGELALVWFLSASINRLRASTAAIMFFAYSALNGLTLSIIFIAYTKASIASTFFITAGTFGAMSLYGYTTKRDLTSWGSFLFMGLIGIILASLVNIFFNSPTIYWLVTYAGILIFVGLTAYDTQAIKAMALQGFDSEETAAKGAVLGALQLYLDFINLFLMLLRLFGRRD